MKSLDTFSVLPLPASSRLDIFSSAITMASLTAGSKLVGRVQNRAFSSSSRSCRLVVKAVTLPAEVMCYRMRRGSWLAIADARIRLQFKSVKPVGDRVLVKVDKEEPKTSGGIIIPSSAQKKPTSGEVVSSSSVVKDVKVWQRASTLPCHISP
jgi:hypothetical protein